MANIIKRAIRIFNGKEWDKYHPETSADQVIYTKADGTASNVQKELTEQNSAFNSINSKFSSELTQGTSGSPGNQGVFKGQSGIMIIWGAHPTTAFAHNSGANYYYADISFRTAFKENPIVMATPRFSGGIPENVGTLSVTPSKLRLGCNAQAPGLYIEWIAVGKWK